MKPVLLALGTLGLSAQQPTAVIVTPAGKLSDGQLPDKWDKLPLLLGPSSAQAILAHRAVYRDNLAKVKLTSDLKSRWQAVRHPFTLVTVFGSWCSDSHAFLPDLLALAAEPNPFIEVHYLGVNRDKAAASAWWPQGCPAQKVSRVPTFYLFAPQPGGGQRRVGLIMEDPPRPNQTMAEALVELLEGAAKGL